MAAVVFGGFGCIGVWATGAAAAGAGAGAGDVGCNSTLRAGDELFCGNGAKTPEFASVPDLATGFAACLAGLAGWDLATGGGTGSGAGGGVAPGCCVLSSSIFWRMASRALAIFSESALGGRGVTSEGFDSACASFIGGGLCFFGAGVAATAGAATTGIALDVVAAGTVVVVAAAGTMAAEVVVVTVAVCATVFVAGADAEVTTGFGAVVEAAATGFGLGGVTFATAFFRPPKSGSLFHEDCNAAGDGFPAGTCVEPILVAGAAG